MWTQKPSYFLVIQSHFSLAVIQEKLGNVYPLNSFSHLRSKTSFGTDIYIRLLWWNNTSPVCTALMLAVSSAKPTLSHNSGLCSVETSSEAFPWLHSIKHYPSLADSWFIFFIALITPWYIHLFGGYLLSSEF